MGDPGAVLGEQVDLGTVELDTVGMPDIVSGPAQVLDILPRPATEVMLAIGDVFVVFRKMGVHHDALVARQRRRFAHQILTDGKRASRGQDRSAPWPRRARHGSDRRRECNPPK